MDQTRRYVFVCLHGSAKSVLAAEYLARAARERGIAARAAAFGEEPDAEIPPHVVRAMGARGYDVSERVPAGVNAAALAGADQVVSFGCDLGELLGPGQQALRWDACPAVSDGFDAAWAFITRRVDELLEKKPAQAR